jgi:serine protease Do
MMRKSNLLALFGVFVLVYGVSHAQDTPKTRQPLAQSFEVFTGDGGSYLGIQTEEVNKENYSKFGLSAVRGVAIEKVLDDSPAKKAGLQNGDVIVRFNGEEVTSYRKLTRLISETAPDHQVRLTVARGGSEREVTVTMGKREMPKFEMGDFTMTVPSMGGGFSRAVPGPDFKVAPFPDGGDVFVWRGDGEGGNFVFGSTRQIGIGVSSMTRQLGDYFGVSDGKGLLINSVNENSPAAKAGLKAGDVVVEVEGKPVSNTVDLIRGISEKKEGEVTLTILRNRNRQTVRVTPEKIKEGDAPFRIMTQPNAVRIPSVPRVRAMAPSRMLAPTRVITPLRAREFKRVL